MKPMQWGDLRVPYTVMWTGEAAQRRPYARRERWGDLTLAMMCEGINKPSGKPLFKMTHGDRCREVIRRRVCQMCVKPLPSFAVGFNQGQWLEQRPLLSDGLPMCPPCALEAFRACPGMRRQAEAAQLRVWGISRFDWVIAPVELGITHPAFGGDNRVNKVLRESREPVYNGPALALTTFTPMSLAELLVVGAAPSRSN